MKKICSECKTENEEQFLYCKNCGNPLEETQKVEEPVINQEPQVIPPVYTAQNPYGVPCDNPYEQKSQNGVFNEPNSVSGIEKEELVTFIGNNGNEIYSKFAKMEYSGSKISWCWPAAILTLCGGLVGGAIWFFYRKMYKIAVILMAVGIAFTVAQTALTYNTQTANGKMLFDTFSEIIEGFEQENPLSNTDNEDIQDIEQAPDGKLDKLLSGIADILDAIQTYAGTALVGMFAMYFYKKHSIKKIMAFKSTAMEPQYYSYCLSLVGGTSGGMLALGIIIAVVVNSLHDGISALSFLSYLGGSLT